MNWSALWPWRMRRAKAVPARRQPSTARLAVETLEDRVVHLVRRGAAPLTPGRLRGRGESSHREREGDFCGRRSGHYIPAAERLRTEQVGRSYDAWFTP